MPSSRSLHHAVDAVMRRATFVMTGTEYLLVTTAIAVMRTTTHTARKDMQPKNTTDMARGSINTAENDLHRIFVEDVDTLRKLWGDYMTNPYSTKDLLETMEHYADKWAEVCTKVYLDD